MNILSDLLNTNRDVLKKTIQTVGKNWMLYPVTFGVWLASMWVMQMAGAFGMLAGIFLWLADSVLLAGYAYAMERVVRYQKFQIQDLKIGVSIYFRKVLILVMIVNMGFIAIGMLVSIFAPFGIYLSLICVLAAFLFLNPLPEATYLRQWSEGETIFNSYKFIHENWIDWFLPMIPMVLILFGGMISGIGAVSHGILPSWGFWFSLGLQALLLPFFMVYRGYLFDTLSRTTRRKRQFMRKMH